MCYGSLFAGFAFANTRTTACHSISYPLTMMYGVEHGFACAVTLIEVMKFNEEKIIGLDELLDAFGVLDINGIKVWMDNVCYGIQDLKLSALGVEEKCIENIVKGAFTAGRMDNNPVEIEAWDVRNILVKVK